MPAGTRVLVAPFPLIVPEEPLALEKLFPLLGLVRVPDAARGIEAARALLRIGGAGHSAVIHSRDPRTILAYGAAVRVLRVAGQRAREHRRRPGLDTNLAPTMTVGTGFFGRSSLTENLQPQHLDPVDAPGLRLRSGRAVRRLRRPASRGRCGPSRRRSSPAPAQPDGDLTRDELRRLILDELRELVGR